MPFILMLAISQQYLKLPYSSSQATRCFFYHFIVYFSLEHNHPRQYIAMFHPCTIEHNRFLASWFVGFRILIGFVMGFRLKCELRCKCKGSWINLERGELANKFAVELAIVRWLSTFLKDDQKSGWVLAHKVTF